MSGVAKTPFKIKIVSGIIIPQIPNSFTFGFPCMNACKLKKTIEKTNPVNAIIALTVWKMPLGPALSRLNTPTNIYPIPPNMPKNKPERDIMFTRF